MSTSYDGFLLDYLEYMIYLSTVSSFWFNIDSSYNHEFHLSKRFGMSPQDLEHLLVAALGIMWVASVYSKDMIVNSEAPERRGAERRGEERRGEERRGEERREEKLREEKNI